MWVHALQRPTKVVMCESTHHFLTQLHHVLHSGFCPTGELTVFVGVFQILANVSPCGGVCTLRQVSVAANVLTANAPKTTERSPVMEN